MTELRSPLSSLQITIERFFSFRNTDVDSFETRGGSTTQFGWVGINGIPSRQNSRRHKSTILDSNGVRGTIVEIRQNRADHASVCKAVTVKVSIRESRPLDLWVLFEEPLGPLNDTNTLGSTLLQIGIRLANRPAAIPTSTILKDRNRNFYAWQFVTVVILVPRYSHNYELI